MKNEKLNEKLKNLWKSENEYSKLNKGARTVVFEYERTLRTMEYSNYTTDYLIISEMWSDQMQEALDFMKEVGINKFVFIDESSEAYKSIIKFLENDCKLSPIVYKIDELYGGEVKEELKGILVEL